MKRANTTLSEERNLPDIVSDDLIEYLADLADGDGNNTKRSNLMNSKERSKYV